jgi:hypothetical protein
MTDETVTGGNSEQTGEKDRQSQSSASQSQLSPDVATLQTRLDELEKLYKGIQKGTDKVNARVEEKVNNLSSQIERITELAKSGKSPVEIEERLLLDEIIRERKGGELPQASVGTETRGQGQVDVQEIAKQLNLDVNDRDIATALASGNVVTVMKVAMSKIQTPSPGPEDAQPLLGGASSGKDDAKTIIASYEKEKAAIPRGSAYTLQRAQLKAKYRKLAKEKGFIFNE